jgi:diguanylate cyclase (GGDEF)-like protein
MVLLLRVQKESTVNIQKKKPCEMVSTCWGNAVTSTDLTSNTNNNETWRELISFKHVYREQFDSLMKIAPWIFAANAFVTVFTAAMFLGMPGSSIAMSWAAISIFVTALSYVSYFKSRNLVPRDDELAAAARKVTILSAVRGLIWAAALATLMPLASPDTALFLGWIIVGMMCGGVFTYWSLPVAAITFSGFIALGGATGMLASNGNASMFAPVVIIAFYLTLSRVAIWNAGLLRKRVRTEQELKGKTEVISLLLKDFEENSHDWLWEMDMAGRMTRGRVGFMRCLGIDTAQFDIVSAIDVLKSSMVSVSQISAVAVLEQLLSKQEGFAQHIISVGDGEEIKFVELSAKPRLNSEGIMMGWTGVASDVTLTKKAEARVQFLAMHDALTGLRNRINFQDQLASMLVSGASHDCWVMYLDLDGFKAINDTLGHAMGDKLLCAVADRLNACLGKQDVLARVGGDEFVILAHGTTIEIESQWRKMVLLVSECFEIDGHNLYIGASIGIVEVQLNGLNGHEIMRRADLALYRAKNEGRGTARHFEPAMDEALQERRSIERDLRLALAQDEFVLHYQPIYSFIDKKLLCYEALLRWKHKLRGDVSPVVFIPIAEHAGLISELGRWVLRQACKDAMSWPKDVCVAVNVSSLQLKTQRFLSDVTNALADSGLPASRLELELTESALVENAEMADQMISDLKKLGVRIALDDFGTGYSSLSYLHKFKFDKIKIDRSFVQAYEHRRESAAVVNAVLMLARDLGIVTTAEGVETTDQFDALAAVGCDQVQGFLLGRPRPLETNAKADLARQAS